MILAFTGSKSGMTSSQQESVKELLFLLKPKIVCHGDCIGADKEFHELWYCSDLPMSISIFPPDIPTQRAFVFGLRHPAYRIPRSFLTRNKNMVDYADFLIATPREKSEVLRSGTWSTVRYARKTGKPHIILTP